MPQRIACQCGNPLEITDPQFEIVNQLSFCAIVINFAAIEGNKCSKCGVAYAMGIQGFNLAAIQLALIAIPPKEEASRIITDVNGFDPKKTRFN